MLKPNGTVRGAGRNVYGELGDGTTTDKNTFVKANNISGEGHIYALTLKSKALKRKP